MAMLMLLYGCITWSLKQCLKKKVDRNYTRMLHAVLKKVWEQKLYSYLPSIWKSRDEPISDVFLWTTIHGHTRVSQPAKTYIN